MIIGKLLPFFLAFIVFVACAPRFKLVATPTIETVNPNSATLTLMDNGSTFNFKVIERFSSYLDDTLYSLAEFSCTPEGIIGLVTSGSALGPGVYPVTNEGATPGSCTCVDRDFSMDIVIQ
jgi:hypothetical protein